MHKHIVIEELKKSLDIIVKHWFLFIWMMIADAFFFFSYGFVSGGIFTKLVDYMTFAATKLSAGGRDVTLGVLIEQTPEVKAVIPTMLLLFILFFISLYILYCIIEGYVWFTAKNTVGQKTSFKDYMLKFFKVNLIWFSIYFITVFIDFVLTFQETIATKYGGETNPLLRVVYVAFWLVIFYFSLLSYTRKKGWFGFGVRNWKTLLPAYLIIGLVIIIVSFIAGKIFIVNEFITVIIGIVFLLPTFVWGRIYLFRIVDALK